MKKNFIFIFCFLAALLQASCCSGAGNFANKGGQKELIITKDDNGRKMSVMKGDVIRIELKELGSAGYGWYIDNLDNEHLELLSKETKIISEGKVGEPVIGVWLFKSKKQGGSEIKMDYYRLWEGKDQTTEHFSITLAIE